MPCYCLWIVQLLAVAGAVACGVAMLVPWQGLRRAVRAAGRVSVAAGILGACYLAVAGALHALRGTPVPFAGLIGIDEAFLAASIACCSLALHFTRRAPGGLGLRRRGHPIDREDGQGGVILACQIHAAGSLRLIERVDTVRFADEPDGSPGPLP